MGRKVNAELLIQHISDIGQPFTVCIPIIAGTTLTSGSALLTEIIRRVSSSAPSEGQEVAVNLPNFTLQAMVPLKRPYFSYINTTSGAFSGNYIVFGLTGSITLTQATLNTLANIIRPYSLVMTGNDLFINNKGAQSSEIGDGIYISCQPTGDSDEEINIMNEKSEVTSISFDSPIFFYIFQLLISCIIFIIMYAIINLIYTNLILNDDVKGAKGAKDTKS
jgi:hypothetical protein